jgi:hypothetical protein
MNRNNFIYLIVGAPALGVVVLGYQVYQDHKKPGGVQINIGPGGVSIKDK